jgi:hypothetical protein
MVADAQVHVRLQRAELQIFPTQGCKNFQGVEMALRIKIDVIMETLDSVDVFSIGCPPGSVAPILP